MEIATKFANSTTKYIYIRSLMEVEHSGEGIVGHRSHNAKLFERIEHSNSRYGIKM